MCLAWHAYTVEWRKVHDQGFNFGFDFAALTSVANNVRVTVI